MDHHLRNRRRASANRSMRRMNAPVTGRASTLPQIPRHRLTLLLDHDIYSPNQAMATPRQLELRPRTHGGYREGAGRRPNPGRRSVPHRSRMPHEARSPSHVTLRAIAGLPSLRSPRGFDAIVGALGSASSQGFRVLQFSIQKDHVHLLLEADTPTGFDRGVRGLVIRIAKALNRVLGRRGRVWGDRFHSQILRTPREVRNALVYILNNWRKHVRVAEGLDPCSSARWFSGWRNVVPMGAPSPIAAARTWLANKGWRKHGEIGLSERPRSQIYRIARSGRVRQFSQ
jgi:putative transposase